MEVKDTILSDEELEALTISFSSDIVNLDFVNYNRAIAKAQAEISFKEGIKAGMMEVVEWVDKHLHKSPECSYDYCFGRRVWQAKLKEWGINQKQSQKGE